MSSFSSLSNWELTSLFSPSEWKTVRSVSMGRAVFLFLPFLEGSIYIGLPLWFICSKASMKWLNWGGMMKSLPLWFFLPKRKSSMSVSSFFLYFSPICPIMCAKALFCAVMVLFCSIKIYIIFCSYSCCLLSKVTSFSSRSSRPGIATICWLYTYSPAFFRLICSSDWLCRSRVTLRRA